MNSEESVSREETPFEKVRRKLVAARIGFMAQLARFSKGALKQPEGEGKTGTEETPLCIAYHLYIVDGIALEQMRRVQEEDNPEIEEFDVLAARVTSTEPPISLDAVLGGMAARREELFEYLASLPLDAWEHPYHHETWGERKFYQLVNALAQHDKTHTEQLVSILAAKTR